MKDMRSLSVLIVLGSLSLPVLSPCQVGVGGIKIEHPIGDVASVEDSLPKDYKKPSMNDVKSQEQNVGEARSELEKYLKTAVDLNSKSPEVSKFYSDLMPKVLEKYDSTAKEATPAQISLYKEANGLENMHDAEVVSHMKNYAARSYANSQMESFMPLDMSKVETENSSKPAPHKWDTQPAPFENKSFLEANAEMKSAIIKGRQTGTGYVDSKSEAYHQENYKKHNNTSDNFIRNNPSAALNDIDTSLYQVGKYFKNEINPAQVDVDRVQNYRQRSADMGRWLEGLMAWDGAQADIYKVGGKWTYYDQTYDEATKSSKHREVGLPARLQHPETKEWFGFVKVTGEQYAKDTGIQVGSYIETHSGKVYDSKGKLRGKMDRGHMVDMTSGEPTQSANLPAYF